jgi:hypothetical protein
VSEKRILKLSMSADLKSRLNQNLYSFTCFWDRNYALDGIQLPGQKLKKQQRKVGQICSQKKGKWVTDWIRWNAEVSVVVLVDIMFWALLMVC